METNREMVNSGIPWIGDVPKSWKIVRNKDVFNNSKTLVGENWINTQLLSLTTKGIKPVAIGSTSGKVPDSYETYQVVEKDNLVMCLFDLDCSAVFSGLSPICGMISPAYKALTIKKGYSPDFYAKWFDYIFDGRKFMFLSKNIRYSLTYDEFASLQVVAPSLSEQQRIAEFLDRKCGEIDEMIALQEKVIEELKAYKQSVITEAVTKGLKPDVPMKDSGIEWIGEIPEHWRIGKIKMIAKTNSGSTPKTISQTEESSIVWIRTTDINDNLVTDSSLHLTQEELNSASCPILNKDVCVVAMYGGGGTIGKCGILGVEATINQALCSIEVKSFHLGAFMFWTLRATRYNWMKFAVGTRKDPNISQEIVRNYIVPIPPIEEQQKISDYLNTKCTEIDNLISIKQSKIDSLKEYKKSIIYEYVTGKREVNE